MSHLGLVTSYEEIPLLSTEQRLFERFAVAHLIYSGCEGQAFHR